MTDTQRVTVELNIVLIMCVIGIILISVKGKKKERKKTSDSCFQRMKLYNEDLRALG